MSQTTQTQTQAKAKDDPTVKRLWLAVIVLGAYAVWSLFGTTVLAAGDKIENAYRPTVRMVQMPVQTPGSTHR